MTNTLHVKSNRCRCDICDIRSSLEKIRLEINYSVDRIKYYHEDGPDETKLWGWSEKLKLLENKLE